MTMALSKAQQHIIDRMRTGWELGFSHAFGSRSWLQQGHIGEGGKSENVSSATVDVLFRKGIIKQQGRRGGVMVFKLAPKSKD